MKIRYDKPQNALPRCEEGDLFVDADGDLNIVCAATHIKGLREEDLLVLCVHGDAAWVRGKADADNLAGLRRLAPGEQVTLTVE